MKQIPNSKISMALADQIIITNRSTNECFSTEGVTDSK